MAKYVYSKYLAKGISNSEVRLVESYTSSWTSSWSGYAYYTIYNGAFEGTSPVSSGTPSAPGYRTVYSGSGDTFTERNFSGSTIHTNVYRIDSIFVGYEKSTFIENLIAEEGTYPENGRHTDGYWYTRGALFSVPSLIQPNGGQTIVSLFQISWTNGTNAVSENLRTVIELSTNNGSSWKVLATVAPGVTSYTHDFSQESESSVSRIRLKHITSNNVSGNYDTSDGVFTIIRNSPPRAPTLINPVGGAAVDRGQVIRLVWRHNDDNTGDAQSKAVLQWKMQGASSWNTINVNNNNNYYDVSSNVFPLGTIVWRAKTYDQLNAEGPYSNEAQFRAGNASNAPVILGPNPIIPVARPTLQWSSSDQVAYQIIVVDSASVTVWDSGEVIGTNKAATIQHNLENGGIYSLRVRIKNVQGLWSEYSLLSVRVAYTPPANPIIQVNQIKGGLRLGITHPIPTNTQPTVERVELYRSEDGSNWERISQSVGREYEDYTVSSNKEYYYRAKAHSTSTMSDSNVVTGTAVFNGVWIHKASDPTTVYQFLFNEDRTQTLGTIGQMMHFAGRKYPVAEYDNSEIDTYDVTLKIMKDSEGLERLMDFIQSRETLCVRDGRGRKLFCHAFSLPVQDEFFGYTVKLSFERVSYSEDI